MNIWRYFFVIIVLLFLSVYTLRNHPIVNQALRLRLQHEFAVATDKPATIGTLAFPSMRQVEITEIALPINETTLLKVGQLSVEGSLTSICLRSAYPESLSLRNCYLIFGASTCGPFDIYCQLHKGTNTLSPEFIDVDVSGLWQGSIRLVLSDKQYLVKGLLTHSESTLQIEGFVPLNPKQPLNILVNSKGELPSSILEVLPPHIFVAASYKAQLNVSGTPAAPQWHAEGQITKGIMESFATGALLQDIKAHVSASSSQLLITSLTARDLQQGTIVGKGCAQLDADGLISCEIEAKLNAVTLAALDELDAQVSGDLYLRGPIHDLTLEGVLEVDKLVIDLEARPQIAASPLEVSFSDDDTLQNTTTLARDSAANSSKYPLKYDLQLNSKKGITIVSDELSSQWSGNVHIGGSSEATLLHGEVRLAQGEFHLSGRKFTLKDGLISFAGDPRMNSSIYLVAQLAIENIIAKANQLGPLTTPQLTVESIVAQAIISGPLATPHLQFRSTPALSQREILSWILFGCGSGEISSFQGAELSRSINLLKRSKGGDRNPLESIKDTIGLDRIEINRGNGDDGFSLQLGKYLAPNIFLGLTKSLSSQNDRLGIEVNMSHEIKFQAEVDNDAQSKFQLKWKRDY